MDVSQTRRRPFVRATVRVTSLSVQDWIREHPEAVTAAGTLDAVAVVDGGERPRQPDLAALGAAADERWDHRSSTT
ncbi:hypothetical protein [Halosimplex sp. TS25]|uniref:hypothetical protein n=1 Tax=Halosimplex rarum TaxID=3396619 RepID=UPI0039ED0EB7